MSQFAGLIESTGRIARDAVQAGVDIGRRESAQRIIDLERDCIILAARLYCESPDTFAPETREVMDRWRLRVDALLQGETA